MTVLLGLALLGGVIYLLIRLARSLEPRQRVVLLVVVVLAIAYFVPRLIRGFRQADQAGAEIRQQQER